MAIFLEDAVKTTAKTSLSLTEFNESIMTECHNFNMASALSENAWQNIIIDCMKEEYRTLNEGVDTKGVGEAVKNFFKRVIEWVKEKFAQIKNFFRNVYTKLTSSFGMMEKFVKDHSREIDIGAGLIEKDKLDAKVTINGWKKSTLPDVKDLIGRFDKVAITTDTNDSNVNDIASKLDQTVEGIFEKGHSVEIDVNRAITATAKANIVGVKGTVKALKDNADRLSKHLKETDKAAKKGLNSANEDEAKKEKTEIIGHKAIIGLLNKKTSAMVSVYSKCASDSYKVVRKAYLAGKDKLADNKAERKAAEKAAAKEAKKAAAQASKN